MQSKPLYEAQKLLQHLKHVERINKIHNKRSSGKKSRNTIAQMHRIRDRSLDFLNKQKSSYLNFQNNKILNKLLQISQRKQVPIYSTIAPHTVQKKASSIITYNNPERKKRQQQILQTNNKLAKRLLTKQSQFDRGKVMKSIQQYQNVRKILQNNRRIKLIPMIKENGIFQFSRVTTMHNSRIGSKSIQNLTNQVSMAQTHI